MEDVLKALKKHLAETTKEQRQKIWLEIEELGIGGPDALEYLEYLDREYPIPIYSTSLESTNITSNMTPNFSGSYFFCNIAL